MAKRSPGLRFQSTAGVRAPTLPTGKRQILTIERLAHDGRGIAFTEGLTWFVAGALPNEQVEARVLSARARVVEARAERGISTHPERQPLTCQHAGVCGGCTVQHLSSAQQRQLKQQALSEQLARAGVLPQIWADPLVGPEWGYRRRARLAVRWDVKTRSVQLGFRAASSQNIVSIAECPVLVPELESLIKPLQRLVQQIANPQSLGHLEVFGGTDRALLVRLTAPWTAADRHLWLGFAQSQEVQLWVQEQGAPVQCFGRTELGYALPDFGVVLGYRPGDFVQVNADVNQAMIAQALDWLSVVPGESVVDLFCGLGNFALPLACQGAKVLGVEGVATMVEQARINAVRNHQEHLCFRQADLTQPDWVEHLKTGCEKPSAVLLDPPRDGAVAVASQMGALGIARVLYVSCNPATLARDAAHLQQQGYSLKRAGILDMFPQTAHVEAMALFERA